MGLQDKSILGHSGRECFKENESQRFTWTQRRSGQSSKTGKLFHALRPPCAGPVLREGTAVKHFLEPALFLQHFQNQHSELRALAMIQGGPRVGRFSYQSKQAEKA